MSLSQDLLTLEAWQRRILPRLEGETFAPSSIRDVTLLAYFFWDDDRINTEFYAIKCPHKENVDLAFGVRSRLAGATGVLA